ncbi:MAG: hypothetical protein QOF72_3054 [Blastocatellia bacterium]|jgi:hypothetical protein|nr:hypothetical protein [Blastocatellia bacterium]
MVKDAEGVQCNSRGVALEFALQTSRISVLKKTD